MWDRGENPTLSLPFSLQHRGVGGRAGLVLELLPKGAGSGVQVGDIQILTAYQLSGLTLGPSAAGGPGCMPVLCTWLSECFSM